MEDYKIQLMRFICRNKLSIKDLYWDWYLNFFVRCDNVFVVDCLDVEYIESEDDLSLFEECLNLCNKDTKIASALYASKKRKWRPHNKYYFDIPKHLWDKFDECGCIRKLDQFNPHNKPI